MIRTKHALLLAAIAFALGCNAFVDSESVGPTDCEVNCGVTTDGGTTDGGTTSPDAALVDASTDAASDMGPPVNCPDVDCGYCSSKRIAIVCVTDNNGCQIADNKECEAETYCDDGACIGCPATCTPGEGNCDENDVLTICAIEEEAECYYPLAVDCSLSDSTCLSEAERRRCSVPSFDCEAATVGQTYCVDLYSRESCEDDGTGAQWVPISPCEDGEVCQAGDCRPAPSLIR